MISGKGLLYTVLAATSAAVALGTMLISRRTNKGDRIGWSFRNLENRSRSNAAVESAGSKSLTGHS